MPQSLSIIIVEKGGSLKSLKIKDYKIRWSKICNSNVWKIKWKGKYGE